MTNLWRTNTPARFWQIQEAVPEELWKAAFCSALPVLEIPCSTQEIDAVMQLTLGEGQFGTTHWTLSLYKRLYYALKPLIPRAGIDLMRKIYHRPFKNNGGLRWPVEDRFARFQWEILRQLMLQLGKDELPFKHFWPGGKRGAFVLTHDVETGEGFAHIMEVADCEERAGIRSSFNLVPERYPIDLSVVGELKRRGFEIGIHGLDHSGHEFSSWHNFQDRIGKMNDYINRYGASGFRSPYTHRHPEWMQALEIEYDLSFFDTDPYEPIAGGTMSIWPFRLGRFIELPYTLVQDHTLVTILGERTPKIWLEKVAFLKRYYGLVLLDSHPDYLKNKLNMEIYTRFLETVTVSQELWHALPAVAATWWRQRTENDTAEGLPEKAEMGKIILLDQDIMII